MNPLPTCRAFEVEPLAPEHGWLVAPLWSEQAVGILGGEPKCCKSFLALELAVAVASGAPCLRRFPVDHPGSVLLFAGEDALPVVRSRIEGIAHASAVDFTRLELHLITVPSLRIDLQEDRERLHQTVAGLRPRLLVLDPFVRLHRADENLAAEVAPLLAYLRDLQRSFATAVLLVHHARKTTHARPGQALRGSSELHAWGDSNLYLRRQQEQLLLTVEHRAAPAPPPLALQLRAAQTTLSLEILDGVELHSNHAQTIEPSAPSPSPPDRILQALAQAGRPLSRRALREAARMRAETLGMALAQLLQDGTVVAGRDGYRCIATPAGSQVPVPSPL